MNWELLINLALTVVKECAVVGVLLLCVAYSVVAERRFCAWIQDRVGPNRTGLPLGGMTIGGVKIPELRLAGLCQPFADGLKFIFKEEATPGHVRKFYFFLAPVLVLVPALVTVSVVPFGSAIDLRAVGVWLGLPAWIADALHTPAVIADIDMGALFVFAIVSLSVYGIVLAGWASNSKYPFLGGIRSSAQMISYEIAMGLAVVPVFLLAGQLNLPAIVNHQAQEGWLAVKCLAPLGAWHAGWHWLLWAPLAVAFFIFLVAAFAETNRLPFDLAECEQELVAGYHTEYGAFKFALFFLGEYAAMLVTSCLMVTLFLGGWTLPFHPWLYTAVGLDGVPWWFGAVHILVFLGKVGLFIFFFIWVRWTLPRFRYDQLMGLGWKFFIPLGLANIFIKKVLAHYQRNGRSIIPLP
ncbi:MAG: NADH-quinone oxidoreductase subunit H [Verrucomicrobiales bacterium]|jgi:NADH-quinone oxidoreductase subunit H|nr:NADH-quinone oxidoreductase subunit H [Verrucomicrobiales bacterium]